MTGIRRCCWAPPLPRRDAQFRRHGAFHLPARRRRLWRRPGHGAGGAVREIPVRRGLRDAQQAGHPGRPYGDEGRARCSPPPTVSTSASRQGRPCGASASRHRPVRHRRAHRAGAADDRRRAISTRRFGGHQLGFYARRLGLQRDPGRIAYRRYRAHFRAGGARPARAPHRRDLRGAAACTAPRPRSTTAAAIRRRSTMPTKRASPPMSRPRSAARHAVDRNVAPSLGGEDFSYMLREGAGRDAVARQRPRRGRLRLHNSRYDFNDMAIPFGVSFFVRLVERFLGEAQA